MQVKAMDGKKLQPQWPWRSVETKTTFTGTARKGARWSSSLVNLTVNTDVKVNTYRFQPDALKAWLEKQAATVTRTRDRMTPLLKAARKTSDNLVTNS